MQHRMMLSGVQQLQDGALSNVQKGIREKVCFRCVGNVKESFRVELCTGLLGLHWRVCCGIQGV